ncbi:RNA polymerase sigma-70 factor [Enhygromyxa salina]|uniref:RNA polymerase sigma-70 factor n=1 Tax=Enhygromyxa salina TaxID=215803 RepID=A0A0C1Z9S2_9BACT|nr:sigma-70 family RNA polymerase sigma factor [Enhygromyxa salina]KIG14329.1 RNA polymerase sigma-70 factor [Enhygromyxa salina]
MSSDDELLLAWRAGDQRAGSELFKRHYGAIRRFFANKVDDSLEDLVQRTFEACVAGQERFEGRGSISAYLRGTARNLLYQHWEARRARGASVPIEDVSLHDLGAGPSSMLARTHAERRLLEALRQVSLADQEILELYYWEELTGVELAEQLGVPEQTARSRLRRARLHLAKVYRRLERFAGAPESSDAQLDNNARGLGRRASQ